MRPTCFEVFLRFATIIPTLLGMIMLCSGGWRAGSPLWEPMLLCFMALGVILILIAALALSWSRRR